MIVRPQLLLATLISAAGVTNPSLAQTYQPPKFNYSYGYQPYNDRNPTGFNHPNDMGYGHYVYSPKSKGHRSSALSYRHFRGY